MNINWFPGHMKKTKEQIIKDLKLVDFVIEIIDARIPLSSSNPLLNEIIINKPRIIILNKSDLANPVLTEEWIRYYKGQGLIPLSLQANSQSSVKELVRLISTILPKSSNSGDIIARGMIVGVPNSGKSTLINMLSNKKSAKTGNKPGITKSTQWIKVTDSFHLLDTPGILWHKFDERTGLHLAFTGAIKDEIMDTETLSLKLIENIMKIEPEFLIDRYKIEVNCNDTALSIMDKIALKRGCIGRGNTVDYTKVSNMILNEFRSGLIGNITLERVNLYE